MNASNIPLRLVAHAKINLTLSVTAKTQSGHHALVSCVCFTDFGDALHITHLENDPKSWHCEISGPFAAELLANGGDYLMQNAYDLAGDYAARFGYELPGLSVHLEKKIPLGGGLGGGSADAACLLRYLSQGWRQDDRQQLRAASLALGADVPACFDSRFHIMSGIGEQAHRLTPPKNTPIMVLANPSCHSETKAIFEGFATAQSPFTQTASLDDRLASAVAQADFASLIAIGNDLTKPAVALYPTIATLLDEMEGLGADYASEFIACAMSGSGASCFALLKNEAAANGYCEALVKKGYWSVMTRFF